MSAPPASAAEALKNQGNAARAAGDLTAAVASYRRALESEPSYVPALYNLGLVLREGGELEEAETCFRRVVDLEPGDVDALFNLASLLRRRLRYAAAGETYRRALALAPGNAHLWLMYGELGIAWHTDPSLREAEDAFGRAIGLQPGLADAHFCLGQVRELLGRIAEALPAYQEALRHDPGNARYCAALVTAKQRLCDWQGLDELWELTRQAVAKEPPPPIEPFVLLSMPSTPAEQLRCATSHAASIDERVRGEKLRLNFRFDRAPGRRLRLGYLSAEFHAHATAYLAAELFELHDRGRFEVVAYSYGPDDGSAMRRRLTAAFDRFVEVGSQSDSEAARAIHADQVDILVDLKGYTFRARPDILALRPAPVQVSYLGYPATMGAPFVDYLVGDRFVTPPADAADFSEKLVLMPDCYQVNDRRRALAAAPSRRELGLPERSTVLCCFNQSYKIVPEIFAAWMRILRAVPESVLWLLEWNATASDNLRAEASRHGIDAARLVFSQLTSLEAHIARLQCADIFLDTAPYNAHTTGSEALWAGLPVLTCAQRTFVSRVGQSLLHASGLPDLVTQSIEQYEALAIRLASGRDELASVRSRLAAARERCPLFDTPRFVRNLEAAYEAMWRRHVEGHAPARIG